MDEMRPRNLYFGVFFVKIFLMITKKNYDPDYSDFEKVFGLSPESYYDNWHLGDLKLLIKDPLIGIEMIGEDNNKIPESVLVKSYSNTIVGDQIPCKDLIVATLRVLLKKYSNSETL